MRWLLLLLASACAGTTTDYDGKWNGTFIATMNNGAVQHGTVGAIVENAGQVNGNGRNETLGESFTLTGRVDGRSFLDVSYFYPGATYRALGGIEETGNKVTGDLDALLGRELVGTIRLDVTHTLR